MTDEVSLVKFYKKYIRSIAPKQQILEKIIFVSNLTNAVRRACHLETTRVYINTRVVKHLYDRKPAEEFDFIIRNVGIIARFPDHIYENKAGKRGEFCLVKELDFNKYLCAIEGVHLPEFGDGSLMVVTCFRIRDECYLKGYSKLWSWKGGDLHRSAFDADSRRSNSTPQ